MPLSGRGKEEENEEKGDEEKKKERTGIEEREENEEKQQQPALNCAGDTFPGAAAVGAAHSSPPTPSPEGSGAWGNKEPLVSY